MSDIQESVIAVLFVALGGGVGAVLRGELARVVLSPWGTAIVNVVACGALGVVSACEFHHLTTVLVASGVLGGLSTFSTFCLDLLREDQSTRWTYLAVNLLGGLTSFGMGAVFCR